MTHLGYGRMLGNQGFDGRCGSTRGMPVTSSVRQKYPHTGQDRCAAETLLPCQFRTLAAQQNSIYRRLQPGPSTGCECKSISEAIVRELVNGYVGSSSDHLPLHMPCHGHSARMSTESEPHSPLTMLLRLLLIAFLLAGSAEAARAKTVAEAFDAEMRAWMVAHGVMRGSLGVMRDRRLVHVVGFGDRGVDARVGIWSLSKAIRATCVATLARDELLSFNSPIGPLLSATFQRYGMPVDPRLERATVLHLVSHRSGIPTRVGGNRFAPGTGDLLRTHEPSSVTAHQLLPEILKIRLTHEPGEYFQYSNVGYLLLGRIVEQVTGKAYEEACYERVLRPSGISGARLHQTWGNLLDAAAGWELSAAEYLAFARQLRPNRKSVLDIAAQTVLVSPDGFWRDDRKQSAYTLGVIVWPVPNALPHLSHTGGWDWLQKDASGGPVDESSGTLFVLASDGVTWFASFDPVARASEQRAREELDHALWRAKRAVTIWPYKDLFPAHQVK